ncbi:hypothetical protein COB18_02820 [Candidatus Kaiserbacteria bacterium]|nr:MAG: hypothetical protein COB80_02590 [Candidatus Kaiserbacteria bacterium]PCI89716.1 MAG: hypothetical protein COB18_02820 [Candidatus Kaiserbacteria bacterium]
MKKIAALLGFLMLSSAVNAANPDEVEVNEVYKFEHDGTHTCVVKNSGKQYASSFCCLTEKYTLNVEYTFWDATGYINPIPYCRKNEESQPYFHGVE